MLPVFAFLLLSFEVDLDEVLAGELVDELLEVGIRLDFEGFALFVGVLDGGFIDPLELSGDEVVELLVLEGSLVELVSVVVGDDCFHCKDNKVGIGKYLSENNLLITDAIKDSIGKINK